MRKLLAAMLLAASLPAMAGDPWTDKQKALGAAFATAYVIDWRQTLHIVVEAACVNHNLQLGIGWGF